jgi:hypothetical protein
MYACVCMYVCVCVCVCVCVPPQFAFWKHLWVTTYCCRSLSLSLFLSVCTSLCMYIFVYTRIGACACVLDDDRVVS